MLNHDGSLYLAYSGEVPRNSPKARLLKRAWESLRRNAEFRRDCQCIAASDGPHLQTRKGQFLQKWGVALTTPGRSFDEVVGDAETIQLDAPDSFNDLFRRLYGDSFYGEDRVVQCEEFNRLYHAFGQEAFQRLSAIARGQTLYDAPLKTLQRSPPDESTIHLTIDVDQHPIAILYKVQFIIRALREARVQAGKADPIERRVVQQLQTLEDRLDSDLVGDGEA